MGKRSRRKARGTFRPGYSPEVALARRKTTDEWETRSFIQGAISVFILFHLIAIACWTVPADSALVADVKELLNPYMQWTGLVQSWNTFAPNPKSVNAYIKAVVLTQNRHIHVWAYPRMEELGYCERYRKARYRKFAENLEEESNAVLLPDVAKHVARMYKDSADPPDEVLLIEYAANIKPGINRNHAESPKPIVLYDGYFAPEDLR